MGLGALPLSPSSHNAFFPNLGVNYQSLTKHGVKRTVKFRRVFSAKLEENEKEEEPKKEKSKQSLFGMVTDALDFSQVRSEEDALLLDEAREATKSGEKMNREQYGALRRKIGGTYKDFFKSYVDDFFEMAGHFPHGGGSPGTGGDPDIMALPPRIRPFIPERYHPQAHILPRAVFYHFTDFDERALGDLLLREPEHHLSHEAREEKMW